MQTEVEPLFGKRPPGIGADAAAILRGIKGSQGVGARGSGTAAGRSAAASYIDPRTDPVTKAVVQTEYFVVPESRLKSEFRDDIRGWVERIARRQSTGGG